MPKLPADYVITKPAIFGIIPKPAKAELHDGEFVFGESLRLCPEAEKFLGNTLAKFGVKVEVDEVNPQIAVEEDPSIWMEGYAVEIEPEKITLSHSDNAGRVYALAALDQLLYLAFRYGAERAFLNCGIIEDCPHFPWRSAMLDSARHFQSADTIVRLLKAMGRLHLNRFHWHLTDSDAWRFPSKGVPELSTIAQRQKGSYTVEDFQRIRKVAAENGIEIVPEVDFPGHNNGLLALRPELRCLPDSFGNEVCIGSETTMEFVKARLDEVMELLPESRYFHIGGDEAWIGWWRQCPKCLAKMKELGLDGPRKLEEWFMRQVSQYLVDKGITPISWRTEAILTPQNILQCWGNAGDMYGCAYHDEGKNLVISSLDNAYYMDYPQNAEEPRFHWMPLLTEESVYSANPASHMGEVLGNRLLGADCPLWTEMVPEWRVGKKFFPRLVAAAESLWTTQEKDYHDYLSRRIALEDAGYEWW